MRRGHLSRAACIVAMAATGALSAQAEGGLYDWSMCPQALASSSAPPVQAGRQWDVLLSPYTHHWNDNPEHKRVNLVAFDRYVSKERFCGVALFTNSFGQPSAYAHVGQRWDGMLGNPKWFAKVSAGLIYGYKGAYKDKIPFNNYGIAPAIIPAMGYQINPRDSVQVMLLGDAGFVLAWGLTF